MAAELFELLRFDCKHLIDKSVQLYKTYFKGNYQLVISTQGKQVYVLTSNVLTHIILLKHDVQSFCINSDGKFYILTSLGQIFTTALSNLASESADIDLDEYPIVIEISDEHSVADVSNALAFLTFGKKIFVLREVFGVLNLEIISDSSAIGQSRENQKSLQHVDPLYSRRDNGPTNTSAIQTRLYILVPFSYKDHNSNDSTVGVLRVCDPLYNSMFGRHSNLLNSPILLVVQPGGIIRWLPLCGFPSKSDVQHGISSTDSVNDANVLCDLEQDVIGVFSYTPNDSKSTNRGKTLPPQSVLLLIGCQGSVLTINCESRDGIYVPSFRRCVIPGPVVCCEVSAVALFYSTGQDLLRVDLGELLVDSRKCSVVEHSKTKSFNIRNVVALSRCVTETVESGETDLFVVTSTGCLSKLSLDFSGCFTRDLQDPTQTLSSQLVGIRQLSDEYRMLGKKSEVLDVALSQLALAGILQSQGHLHFVQRNSEKAQSFQRSTSQSSNAFYPVRCLTSVQISNSKSFMTVVLQNCSNFVFRKCWTFQATVSKQRASGETGMAFPRLSSSCCIDGLSSGESTSVMVELPCDFTSPFLISPSLILDLQDLLPSSANIAPLVLSLPDELFTELRLLRPLACCGSLVTGTTMRDLSKILQAIVEQHSYTLAAQKDRLTSCDVQDYRFDICIPDRISEEIVQLDPSIKSDKGDDCQMLLKYLFASNSFFKDVSFENRTLTAVSSRGHLVTVNVHISGPANSGGGSSVSLQSSHTGLLAQLHLDIMSRLKMLSCVREIPPSSNEKCRKARLKEVEELLLEFHDESTSNASTITKVSSLYRSVRSMRL